MIHFDWDILGVNLETFSPEMTPLQPCLGETPVTPKQVELFTSLLRQEAMTVETSSLRPTMFPQSIITLEKPQHVRQMPIDVITNAPVTENTTPSVEVLSTQIPTTQKSVIQLPMAKPLIVQTSPMQLPTAQVIITQIPIIAQTVSAQMFENTPSITVKASISTPLQPTPFLEALESLEVLDHLAPLEALEPLETVAMPLVMENAKPSLQELVAQMPMPQRLSVQIPIPQKPSVQMPVAQMPVAQMPIFVQTTSAQEPVSTPYITVKASVSTPLQPTVPLESLVFLEPLETVAIAPATENTRPSTEAPFMEMPVAQMPFVAQTTSAQVPASASYITVKAPVSAPLQPMASLENLEALESLEVLDHLEPLETTQKPVMAAANTPVTESTRPSVEESSTQMPSAQKFVNAQTASAQMPIIAAANTSAIENTKPSVEVPSMQMPIAQMPFMQEPVAQKPIIAQTTSAQAPVHTPHITVKASVSTPLQPTTASLESLVFLEPLVHLEPLKNLEPLEKVSMAPAMENTKLSMEAPSTQMPMAQMPITAQTLSVQEPANTPYITVKASVSTPLQPTTASLESLVFLEPLKNLEPLETAAMAPTIGNTKPSVQVPSTQMPSVQMPIIAQTLSAQEPVSTQYITVKASVSTPLLQMPSLENLEALESLEVLDHLEPLETAQKPIIVATNTPAIKEATPSVEVPSTQMPVVQIPVIAQTLSAQVPANTPYITIKASVAVPLQPAASLESLESLEVLDHLEPLETAQKPIIVATNTPAIKEATPSVEMHSTQMPVAQMPSMQEPMAQKPIIAQTLSAQVLANTPYITIKASVAEPLQPAASLESLESLEVLDHLELLVHLEPLETAAMAPAMENAKQPSVEMHFTQMPMVAQMPITAQTLSAQMLTNTPYITVKAPVSTPLQPTAPLESLVFLEPLVHLEPLKNLEPLETAAMAPAMENAKSSVQEPFVQMPMPQKPFVQIPTPQKPSAQIPTAQKPITAQTLSAPMLANTPYITVKPSVSTLLQPTAPLEPLVFLEPLVHLEPLKNLEPLETAAIAPAMENVKSSVQEASVQMPIPQKPSAQIPTAQKPIIVQTAFAQEFASTSYITSKVSVSAPQQPMASLENLVLLEPLEILETPTMENTKPSVQLPISKMPAAQTPSTQVSVAQKPITVQTPSAHISTHTPYITIKPPHSFTQKLEAPQKPLQKPSSMPDVVAPSIHAAATAISQPTDLAMPSVTPVNASSMAMSPAQILSTTVNELTAAIMVNIDENGHLGEIRLVLKPDVLDGTTILLKCDQKQISVTFFPGAESAEQLLMANQSRIAETLAATGHLPVKISIIYSESRRQIRKTA